MEGVRIRWQSPDPRPWAGSDFARYFGGVLPRLDDLTWLVDEQAFAPPDDLGDAEWEAFEGKRRWVAQQGESSATGCLDPNYVAGPGFVPDYADWCNDDWNWLYGFDRPPADWRRWLRRRAVGTTRERAAHLAATVAVCFFAVDRADWEFFARDPDLVAAAAAGVHGVAGLVAAPAVLADSAGL